MSDPRRDPTVAPTPATTTPRARAQYVTANTPPPRAPGLAAAPAAAGPGDLSEGEVVAPGERPGPGAPAAGLVPRDISVRSGSEGREPSLWEQFGHSPRFPTAELVSLAVDAIPREAMPTHQVTSGPGLGTAEGPQRQVVVGPGVIRLRGVDLAAAERTAERQARGHLVEIDEATMAAREERERTWEMAWDVVDGEVVIPPEPERPPAEKGRRSGALITEWSAKSQANMQEQFASLDFTTMFGHYAVCQAKTVTPGGRTQRCTQYYSPELDRCPACGSDERQVLDKTDRLPALSTLTYPGDWLRVAPSSEVVKGHHASLAKRYERGWGEPWVAIWKQEFQRREAPHFHDFHTPPPGRIDLELEGRTAEVLAPGTDARAVLCQRGHVRATADPDVVSVDYEGWLSITWPEIVDHPDVEEFRKHLLAGTGVDRFKAMDLRDPRRVAAYFAGYSRSKDKSYQNEPPRAWLEGHQECAECREVYLGDFGECPECGSREVNGRVEPAGPGRYWGLRGLSKARVAVDVDHQTATRAARVLRRWHRAEQTSRAKAASAAVAAEVRSRGGSSEEAAAAARRAYVGKLTRVVRRPRARPGRGRLQVANHEWREVTAVDMDVYRDTLGQALDVAHTEQRRLVRHEVHDVLGVAGAALVAAYAPQQRRTRVRRRPITQDGRGRALLNDAPAFAAKLGDWLAGRGPDREERAERLRATRLRHVQAVPV